MSENQVPEEYKKIIDTLQKQFIALQVSFDNYVQLSNNVVSSLMNENLTLKKQMETKPIKEFKELKK